MKKKIGIFVLLSLTIVIFFTCAITGVVFSSGSNTGLEISQGSTVITNNSVYNFSDVTVDSSVQVTFTIHNTTQSDITISESISLSTGVDYSVIQPSTLIITPQTDVTFGIVFNPKTTGFKMDSAMIKVGSITSFVTLNGTGIAKPGNAPILDFKQGTTVINNGGTVDFGDVTVDETDTKIFTISNSGNLDLVLSGNITVSDTTNFSVVQPTNFTIPVSDNTTCSIIYMPKSTGSKSATVTINSNDTNSPFTFTVTGGVIAVPSPIINIKQGTTNIPRTTGTYDFGNAQTNSAGTKTTFTIENNGDADLIISGSISVDDTTNFTVFQPTLTTIAASSSTTFDVSFDPVTLGTKSATITITHNDANMTPYTFALTGKGVSWELVDGYMPDSGNYPYFTDMTFHNGELYVIYQDDSYLAKVKKYTEGVGWSTFDDTNICDGDVFYTKIYSYDGVLYVCYSDYSDLSNKGTVKKYVNGTGWVTIGSTRFTAGKIKYPSLYVYNDVPYFAFSDFANSSKITVMEYDATADSWGLIGTAGFSVGQANYATIRVYAGIPYVTYEDDGDGAKCKVQKYNGSNWVDVDSSDPATVAVNYTDMEIDSNGDIYVAYQGPDRVMKYTVATGWQQIGSDFYNTEYIRDIDLELYNGVPYVAFIEDPDNNVNTPDKPTVVKYIDGTGWEVVGFPEFGNNGTSNYSKFAMDVSDDTPYVVYTEIVDASNHDAAVYKFVE